MKTFTGLMENLYRTQLEMRRCVLALALSFVAVLIGLCMCGLIYFQPSVFDGSTVRFMTACVMFGLVFLAGRALVAFPEYFRQRESMDWTYEEMLEGFGIEHMCVIWTEFPSDHRGFLRALHNWLRRNPDQEKQAIHNLLAICRQVPHKEKMIMDELQDPHEGLFSFVLRRLQKHIANQPGDC